MGVSSAIGTYDSCYVSEFRCMQAITADTVNAYNITHDDQPNMSSASSLHGAKRRGGLWDGIYFAVQSRLLPLSIFSRREHPKTAGAETL